ncbi:MAG TPA: MBL fold metallo-hydrolase [Candidatus Paceibacterota bacterium]|nr:MBL fold metallo-hydrolase [Candidatus Paceibacterota bacterium]
MADKTIKIGFYGGTEEVTGSNFLIEDGGKRFLIDCGLIQSFTFADHRNWETFPYDAKAIDGLIVTHAHVDHIGRIPKLIHEGFRGKIYSTPPTKELAAVMLRDTANILSKDKRFPLAEIYNEGNIQKALSLWQTMPYHSILSLTPLLEFCFHDAGHILGSAMIHVKYAGKTIIFTGDLGNSPSPLLRDSEPIGDADYLVMESVYGDRNHEDREKRREILASLIEKTYQKKGILLIPTFSLERVQELLYEIDGLVENSLVPTMPIFLDSPLAIELTKIYKDHQDYFNKHTQFIISAGDDIFNFPGLKETFRTEESKNIFNVPAPKIIIAGSGMSSGGRILHHEKNYLADPKTTVLLTGYQTPGTLGHKLQEGAKTVTIFGENTPVAAEIVKISGYSGHKDSDHLVEFVEKSKKTLEKVFVVMGEPMASMHLVSRLKEKGVTAIVPKMGEVITLSF